MEYISVEEFFEQDERARDKLLKWWMPQKGDICYHISDKWMFICNSYYPDYTEQYKDKDLIEYNNFSKYDTYYRNTCIPLLTEGQLREIIKEYFGFDCKVELEWCNGGYQVNTVSKINDEKVFAEFPTNETEPLKAYWNVVLDIINKVIMEL